MFNIDNNELLALNEEAEEINSRAESPALEETAEEVIEEAVETTVEAEPKVTETVEEEEPKKGFQNRVRELNAAKKAAEERAQSLEEKLAELTRPVGPTPQVSYDPLEPIVADGEEISVAELNKRVAARDAKLLQQADARSELRQRQSEAISRINSEANAVIGQFPELNPDHEDFNKELSDTITEATEAYIKASPYTASVKTFVAKLMKPYKRAVTNEIGKATENIARQVSQAALRPTSIRKEEKTANEKSIKELEAELGVYQA